MTEQSFVRGEIASQPDLWRKAAAAAATATGLPVSGEHVAVVGCGTSWFMAQAYATMREATGAGPTDAFPASEMPLGRSYDRIVAITRSGTTTEILQLLDRVRGPVTTVLTGVPEAVGNRADHIVDLGFADERSVVQTRFATCALVLLRAHLGADIEPVATQAEPLSRYGPSQYAGVEQFTFVGTGFSVGIANEAALKLREASRIWTESYPAHEYRHGPISIAAHDRVVWVLGAAPDGLAEDVRTTGATFVNDDLDPLADLVRVQQLAVDAAERHGMNPDQPRNLSRSVVLG